MARKVKVEVIERERKVLEMRRGGLTFDLIAKRLGYSGASGAFNAYQTACKRILVPEVDNLRLIETERLDIAQSAIWSNVLRGDVQSIITLLKIMERRARLLGLDMPTRAQIEVTHYDSDTIDAEVIRLATLLDGGTPKALDARPSENRTDTD